MFKRKSDTAIDVAGRLPEFSYLKDSDVYLDSACQSLRPQSVLDSMSDYYQANNACGGRVKYRWGQKVDSQIEETRDLVIRYLGLPQKEYICSFTLNTTYGINLVLSQLPTGVYEQVVTSEVEHNSVFLPTIELAKRLGVKRKILQRNQDGSLIYGIDDISKSVVVVSSASNIDGRLLTNIAKLIKDTHEAGGIVVIDAAQTVAHYKEILIGQKADVICFSAHKMYAASLGVIVIRKDLLRTLDLNFVGGGMISSVQADSYSLLPDDMSSWLEPGLQAYAEIISLKTAVKWLSTVQPFGQQPTEYIAKLSEKLYIGLSKISDLAIFNDEPSSVISVYSQKVDAHRLATFLSTSGIMVRSGYFCCHYYLIEKLKMPPMLRFSIGLHTTEQDISKTIELMNKFIKG